MNYLDNLIAGMQSQDDKDFDRVNKQSLELNCEGIIANAMKNCVWVGYNMHSEPIDVFVSSRGGDQAYSRVDITAEPMMYIPSTLFRSLTQEKAKDMDYPYRMKDVTDALQATRSKKMLSAKLPKDIPIDLSHQQRVVIVPVIPFLVRTGIDPLSFYPEQTHNWRYINF